MADVYFLLDMSSSMKGSMALYKILDFFTFQKPDMIVSLYFFNQATDRVVDRCRLSYINVDSIIDEYTPCGSTSLYDAIDFVVTDAELHAMRAPKIIIYTDGVDTSSKYCNIFQIKEGIRDLQKNGWTFVFMGASIEAYKSALDMGFHRKNTINCFEQLYEFFS